jgi:sensor histidine kinase regulating citrate/malate metabolism
VTSRPVRTAQPLDQRAKQVAALRRLVRALREQTHEHANRLHAISGLLALDEVDEARELVQSLEDSRVEARRRDRAAGPARRPAADVRRRRAHGHRGRRPRAGHRPGGVFDRGRSTKDGHDGFGLAVVREAVSGTGPLSG